MEKKIQESLFVLLRLAFDANVGLCTNFKVQTAKEWHLLYSLASKLSMLGVAYYGICKLPKDQQPPIDIIYQWASEAETIRGHNRLVNAEAARLTELFASRGRRTAILKGAANARLYPDKFMRQCGDIDIWIDGGREGVIALLQDLNLIARPDLKPKSGKKTYNELYSEAKNKLAVSEHHVHLAQGVASVSVEAHFKPSSGNNNPFTNKRLLPFLENAIKNVDLVPEGFYAPSLKFALVMQLSHIQKHFFESGIGLKQVVDYYVLLRHSTDDDRAEISGKLKYFGISQLASALMWVLGYVLGLESERMLCPPNERLGRRMLDIILMGGNFGFYSSFQKKSIISRWFGKRCLSLKFCPFSVVEVFWAQVAYWKEFLHTLPVRIKLRKLSIRDIC